MECSVQRFSANGLVNSSFFFKQTAKIHIKIQRKFQLNHYVYESLQGLEILFSQIQ